METYRLLIGVGSTLASAMAILLYVGTTSMTTFVSWIVLLFVGLGIATAGQRMRDRR